jgi:hypothetical protein
MKSLDEIEVSTSTIISTTNMDINLDWFYSILPVIDAKIPSKIKYLKQFQKYIIDLDPPYGTITLKQFGNKIDGVTFKRKKKKGPPFRNSLSLVMYVGKLITIKVPIKGKIHCVGCTSDDHPEKCIEFLYRIMRQYPSSPETYRLIKTDHLRVVLFTVMTNFMLRIGFDINRKHLDMFVNRNTKYNSLLEASFGYTGVIIKMPFEIRPEQPGARLMTIDSSGAVESQEISYAEYLKTLTPVDRKKELAKRRKNSFMVFHSGTCILSCKSRDLVRDSFKAFTEIVTYNRDKIEEVIDKL